ncbi:CU044_2847 family protein [Streptomyces sp. G5(2025)]|uniref:CU044_2847 family protein n=1 Tax=Streptomyces sp. G5(2025) TaxID=3406628 RepID=UPI003C1C3F65
MLEVQDASGGVELMIACVRMPLEGGGTILLEEQRQEVSSAAGPVKVGRLGDAVRELPRTLQESLVPVRETARAVLESLREAGSRSVEVEFGVNLSAKAGAVITTGEATVHLKVRVVWEADRSVPADASDAGGV